MGAYCTAIWHCRYFWLALVRMDLRARYRGSVLGMGWSLLQPIAMTAIICLVFCRLFHLPVAEMAAYVMVGLACWNYILTAMLAGCQCFFQGESYIRQFPAPMAIYPLRTVLGAAFHLFLALAVGFGLALMAGGARNWDPQALLTLPATFLLLLLAGWSLATLAGLATVFFRDTRHLAEVGFQVVFYLTPIFYPKALLASHGLNWIVDWNPIVPFLELVRQPIGAMTGDVAATVPGFEVFARAAFVTLLLASGAMFALTRLEKRLIFHL
jgi:ABC-type polysaccharide/polyol phosphate export permease